MTTEAVRSAAVAATYVEKRPAYRLGRFRPLSIRARLALWSATILAVGLLCCSTLVYLLASHALRTAGDDRLASRARRIEAVLRETTPTADSRQLARALSIFVPSTIDYALLNTQGQVVLETPRLDPLFAGQAHRHLGKVGVFYDQIVGSEQFRTYLGTLPRMGSVSIILVVHNVDETLSTLATLRDLLLGGDLLCMLSVSAAAWLLARRALAPIDTIMHTAAGVARSADPERCVPEPPRYDEVGRLTTSFNTMLASLAASQASLKRFVSDASHELRTPITSIRGNADVLVMAPDLPVDERMETARDISDEAAYLSRLVDGLLALAIGDAGLPLQLQPVALHELLRSVCRSWANRPGPRLYLADCDPATIMANPLRIEQLLTILLDNAMKYTPADGSVFCVLQADACTATLSVRDTGRGIDPTDLPHIFDRFYRAKHIGGGTVGAGLGLAIARQIVDETGGAIEVTSERGKGATFIVRMPLAVGQYSQAEGGEE